MALHTELPIYRTGVRLLDLAIKAQIQMPRTVKRALGEKITHHCVEMLDLMALANATQREVRAGHIDLHCDKSLGYTSQVTSKKGVIGCGSPKERGHEPQHRIGLRLFCSCPSFGGPDGEAQASPVTLRVPRSSTPVRAAAQCGSWSAVVHLERLEITMAITATSGTTALIASDLIIEITPHWTCRFRGTRAQLIAEGLIPSDFKWPNRTQRQSWEAGKFEYWMQRCRPAGIKGPQSVWADGDYWVLNMSAKGADYRSHVILEKKRELAELVNGKSGSWFATLQLAHKAHQDQKYMAFRTRLLGDLTPRKRGRPAQSSTNGTQELQK